MTNIGQQLRAARMARGWTQRQLAAKADVSQALIQKIESGGAASVKVLDQIAAALGGQWSRHLEVEHQEKRQAVTQAEYLPIELDLLAQRWLRLLPHLSDRVRSILLAEIELWEEETGIGPPSDEMK